MDISRNKVIMDNDYNYCYIEKEENKNSVIVAYEDDIVLVTTIDEIFNPIEGIPFILLAKTKKNNEDMYETYLHVIGKMLSKDIDSKYFGKRRRNEHLNNGNFKKYRTDAIILLAKNSINRISSILSIDYRGYLL